MTHHAHRVADEDIRPDSTAAADPYMRLNNRPFAHCHVVRHLDQITNNATSPDHGFAQRGPVDCCVCTNTHIIFYHDEPNLWDLTPVAVCLFRVPETVTADHGAGLQNDSFADLGFLADGDVLIEDCVFADHTILTDEATAQDLHPIVDSCTFPNDHMGVNANTHAQSDSIFKNGCRVNKSLMVGNRHSLHNSQASLLNLHSAHPPCGIDRRTKRDTSTSSRMSAASLLTPPQRAAHDGLSRPHSKKNQ